MNPTITQLTQELESDQATLDRELTEIELLLRQTKSEAERHEARRVQAEERVQTLESDQQAPVEAVSEARGVLLSQTRRATLMQSQVEVLEGKQRALQRYHNRLAQSLPVLRGFEGEARAEPSDRAPTQSQPSAPSTNLAPGANGGPPAVANRRPASHEVLAAQEEMRREIARQMHDGPAQSIANIALQAQIVERLFERDPKGAQVELNALVTMVEEALRATKDFIFDVRPMVLDDLGLVPTLRRSAAERTRRQGVAVRFESAGSDRRLATELESAVFRIVDDAMIEFASARPPEILVRLDWSESGLSIVVRGRPVTAAQLEQQKASAAVAAARRDKELPQALASMIREQEREDAERAAGLSVATWTEIEQRATAAGIAVKLSEDRWLLEAQVGNSQ
ncbi:MAG TPA: histidine kinase [Candidatus Limnocylindrales bacterium]|nr:histidine kinase [Candidatus Limnocylindrales bacterium]